MGQVNLFKSFSIYLVRIICFESFGSNHLVQIIWFKSFGSNNLIKLS